MRTPAPPAHSGILRSEREDKAGAAASAVFDADAAAVQFNDAFDERQSYPRAAPASTIGAPKSREYRLLLLVGNSGALIFDDNGSFPRDSHGHCCSARRGLERIVDDVAHSDIEKFGLPGQHDRPLWGVEFNGLPTGQGEGGQVLADFAADRVQVDWLTRGEHRIFGLRQSQQLVHEGAERIKL